MLCIRNDNPVQNASIIKTNTAILIVPLACNNVDFAITYGLPLHDAVLQKAVVSARKNRNHNRHLVCIDYSVTRNFSILWSRAV